MPTFDFANIVRKIVSTAVAAVSNPVSAVLACAALLSTFLSDIVSFFSDDLQLPTISLPSLSLPSEGSSWFSFLLYLVRFDQLCTIVNSVTGFISSLLTYSIEFFTSLAGVLILYGSYRVIRSALKDYV